MAGIYDADAADWQYYPAVLARPGQLWPGLEEARCQDQDDHREEGVGSTMDVGEEAKSPEAGALSSLEFEMLVEAQPDFASLIVRLAECRKSEEELRRSVERDTDRLGALNRETLNTRGLLDDFIKMMTKPGEGEL